MEVLEQIDGIPRLVENNSAAIEEISAASEEINAQVEEGIASAQVLDDLSLAPENAAEQFSI